MPLARPSPGVGVLVAPRPNPEAGVPVAPPRLKPEVCEVVVAPRPKPDAGVPVAPPSVNPVVAVVLGAPNTDGKPADVAGVGVPPMLKPVALVAEK